MRFSLTLLFIIYSCTFLSQSGIIKGVVRDVATNEELPFANIFIDSAHYAVTDIEGVFLIDKITPGTYSLKCSFVGYRTTLVSEIIVLSSKSTVLELQMEPSSSELTEVEVTTSTFKQPEESPVGYKSISASEIYRSPGGNRDISKVVQNLPGVASGVSFRNDLIVRGGAPGENKFYLDGIEIPNINHFATQGSSGGPVGMLNVNLINSVDFYAAAAPVNIANGLSSVLSFQVREGNQDEISGNFMVGSSDVGLLVEGPIGKRSNFTFSMRRSYLQLLFKALKLPFLPTYNDFQFKQVFAPNDKNKITIIGLGAIDNFELNRSVNKGVEDENVIVRNNYLLGNLPVNEQWNYAAGVKWTRFLPRGYLNFIVSRNVLNNSAYKYLDNENSIQNLLFDYKAIESEFKSRIEVISRWKNGVKLLYGLGVNTGNYQVTNWTKLPTGASSFNTQLRNNEGSGFAQVSKRFLQEKILLAGGIRSVFADYNQNMSNPFNQLGYSLGMSYNFNADWSVSTNSSKVHQLPAYTLMGFQNLQGELANKQELKYLEVRQQCLGLGWRIKTHTKISVEGFYKRYFNYPVSVANGVSLANLGADFGVIGNEAVTSNGEGQSYGLELVYQRKFYKNWYAIMSYTLVKSEFSGKNKALVSSAWDNGNICNLTIGKQFKRDWEIGAKFRLQGGAPYTPYDLEASALVQNWDLNQQGILDWSNVNASRLPLTHALDVRVDKKWYFRKWEANLYFDIQNVYNSQFKAPSYLDVVRDDLGNPVVDPINPEAYLFYEIKNTSGTLLPSLGIMIGF